MRIFFAFLLTTFSFTFTNAQVIAANDSVSTANDNVNMCFYNLNTGQKTLTSNTDWDLAVTVRPTQFPNAPLGGTSIRINEANGVRVFISPTADASSFNSLDTTGWNSWEQVHDSDTAIDEGALNSNRNHGNIFDFGWGKYNATTHNVTGDSIFLIQLSTGELKKFLVVALVFDTTFNLQYSNLDNSDLQNITISKRNYLGKEFVYLDLTTNIIHDKEPLAIDWDLQFLKYAATDVVAGQHIAEVGGWVNKGTTVARAYPVDITVDNTSFPYSSRLNSIGWNWELYDSANMVYHVQDSLSYFIQANNGQLYKIVFTGFGGSNTGVINFNKYVYITGITSTGQDQTILLFPNPVNNEFHLSNLQPSQSEIRILDVLGKVKLIQKTNGENQITLDASGLVNGMYLLEITSGESRVLRRFVVAR